MTTNNIILLVVISLTLACVQSDVNNNNNDWWKHATFYQIYPRSFKDSNNDGVGDLQGIISKLEHLKDAGITAAWLSPIYSSPQVDQGYDISNFTDIHYEYGTIDDFKELIEEANKLDLKIIMDFVPNHSSDEHEWFVKSENRVAGYEDYYVWRDPKNDGPPNNWLSLFKYSAWKFSEKRQQYYLHQFAIQQPDLNYKSSKLVQEMKDVMTFWLDLGVSGFRVDAVPFLFEDENLRDEPLSNDPSATPDDYTYLNHTYTMDLPATYDMVYQFRKHVDNYSKAHGGDARILMTEAYTSIEKTVLYYGDNNTEGSHFPFNFLFITDVTADNVSPKSIVDVVNKWMSHMPKGHVPNWVIGNHDNHRAASRFGKDRADGFNMLVSVLPGVAVTYNGEEIAMEDGLITWEQGKDPSACNGKPENFNKTSRDFERTPFHWNDSVNAGFNEGAETWLPVSDKYKTNNLLAQSVPNVKSHYHIYKKLRELRNSDTLTDGDFKIVQITENSLAIARVLDKKLIVFVFNLSDKTDTVNLVEAFDNVPSELTVVLASVDSKRNTGDNVPTKTLSVSPYEAIVLNKTEVVDNGASSQFSFTLVTTIVAVVLHCYIHA